MASTINSSTSNGIVITPDTSGEIKLQSAGTDIATVSSSGITMASGKGLAATGHVLQVVNATQNTEVATTSSSLVDTGLTATITPSATSSKIAVFYVMPVLVQTTDIIQVALIRGSTNILNNVRAMYAQNPSSQQILTNCIVDSPSTTSATTYKVQFSSGGTASSVFAAMWNNESPASIILMEVAG